MATSSPSVPLLDIGGAFMQSNIRNDIVSQLSKGPGEKSLPFSIFYDSTGLDLFDQITRTDEYYLDRTERAVLEHIADAFAADLKPHTRLIELGSGNLDKVCLLLDAFERQRKPVDYFALDISRGDLEESFAKIDVDAYRFVRFHGLHGSYKDCAGWIASGAARGGGAAEGKAGARLCVFSLGSSVSNFTPAALKELLGDFAAALQGGDRVVLSVDTCEDQGRIYDAFNDAAGVTTRFYLNGVENANRIVGGARSALLDMAAWELRTQMRDGCHVADLVARRALELRLGDDDDDDARVPVAEGERVELEQYRSFPRRVLDGMLEGTGLGVSKSLCGERGESWAFYQLQVV